MKEEHQVIGSHTAPNRKLLDRLRTHGNEMPAFALETGVLFTNNQAERSHRPAKVKLKVSDRFRIVDGARAFVRLQAVTLTFRHSSRQDSSGTLDNLLFFWELRTNTENDDGKSKIAINHRITTRYQESV